MAAGEAGIAASSRRRWRVLLLLCVTLAGVHGCAQPGRPPVAERSPVFRVPESYVVRPGDTLYAIAWRFGLDYVSLARANDILEPYTIYVGQRVRLDIDRAATPPRTRTPAPPAARVGRESGSAWRAPTQAPVKRGFGNGNKGIDYELAPEHVVVAAAAGEVVYAGSGLGGFRHLVIVKHDSTYLSAYSVNRPVSLREGQRLAAGAVLAGKDSERPSGILHFEIRRNGEPMDPVSLIGR